MAKIHELPQASALQPTDLIVVSQGNRTRKAAVSALPSSVGGVTSVAGKMGAVSLEKADVGLQNVDNTADADKPLSAAQIAALGTKFDNSGGTITGNVSVPRLNGGQLAGFRNHIINGNFDIWQRGESFTVESGVQAYAADRMLMSPVNAAVTLARTSLVGTFRQRNTGAASAMSVTGQTGLSYFTLEQRVEDVAALAGTTATFSIYSTAAVATAYFRIVQSFGSGGSATVTTDLPITAVEGEHGDTRWVATGAVPSIAGKTVGAGAYMTVAIIVAPNTATQTTVLYGMQAERGPVATPFEQRSYGMELSLCRRYYRLNGNAVGVCIASNFFAYTEAFDTPMRAAPTITARVAPYVEAPVFMTPFTASGTAIYAAHSSTLGMDVFLQTFSGMTPGVPGVILPGQIAYSAEL